VHCVSGISFRSFRYDIFSDRPAAAF